MVGAFKTAKCIRASGDSQPKSKAFREGSVDGHADICWFEEVWNQGHEGLIDELTTEDAISHGLSTAEGDQVRGPATFRPFYRRLKAAFPDIDFAVEDAVCEDDKIAARI